MEAATNQIGRFLGKDDMHFVKCSVIVGKDFLGFKSNGVRDRAQELILSKHTRHSDEGNP